ncbi:MAG: hypothetical protein M1831_007310 [Alyxoria varia]|nr:MAG: hypothetical protein M1831_007310 [Alyxoria varia]
MSGSQRSDKVYHQDYIARIRYNNTLPPPPNPPKLLQIPGTGLGNGHYTSAAFASRLIREQPLNIEADAELGMPIDLVGLPGVFEGDESSIQGLNPPPPPHPRDKPLLKPFSSLGKSAAASSNVAFLKKAEPSSYSVLSRGRHDATAPHTDPAESRKKRRTEDPEDNDPARIAQDLEKSFDLANSAEIPGQQLANGVDADRKAWDKPRHPKKPGLKLLDSYPVLPDLASKPDLGGFIVIKFNTNPMSNATKYDDRFDTGLFRPLPLREKIRKKLEAERAEHEIDPSQPIPSQPYFDYDFYLPKNGKISNAAKKKSNSRLMKRKHSEFAENGESEDEQNEEFTFERLRTYETHQQSGDPKDPYGENIVFTLEEDDERTNRQKAAYVYPVIQRTFLRPRRLPDAGRMGAGAPPIDEDRIDQIELTIAQPQEEEGSIGGEE